MDKQKRVFDTLGLIFSIIIPVIYAVIIFALYFMFKGAANHKPDDSNNGLYGLAIALGLFALVVISIVLGAWIIVSIIGISLYKKGKPSILFLVNAIAFTTINFAWTYNYTRECIYTERDNVGVIIASLALLGFAVSNLIVQIKRNKLLA